MRHTGEFKMRTTPATDDELECMRHFRERGTTPGMPKWYLADWRKRMTWGKPGVSRANPITVLMMQVNRNMWYCPPPKIPSRCDSPQQYIREFAHMNGPYAS